MKDIKVKNSFGEKFYAEVIVDNDSQKGLKVFIGSHQDYALLKLKRSTVVDELRIIEPIEFVSNDQQLVSIISDKPLFYPSFDLVLKASLGGGTILEKYSLVVDFEKKMSIALSPPALEGKALPPETTEMPEEINKKALADSKAEVEAIEENPVRPDKVAVIDTDGFKAAAKDPNATEIKPDSIDEETSSENRSIYKVTHGDTLSSILKKIRPQQFNFYKSLVALWKLNKELFLFNNINGLEVGTQLSFNNLEDEINKISNSEASKVLAEHNIQWETIRTGVSLDIGKEPPVSEIPLPGENLLEIATILEILSGWRQSWESGDFTSHFSYYSDDFLSENYSSKNIDLAGWKQYKTSLAKENKSVKIIISDLHVSKEKNKIIASFLQKFSADNLISFGTKNIMFVREGEQWKIKEELFRKQGTEIFSSDFPFVVQTSSHEDWALATKEANRLRNAGFAAYLVKSTGNGGSSLFRVVTGRFRAQIDAYYFAKKLIQGKYVQNASVQKLPYVVSLGSSKNELEAYKIVQKFRNQKYSPYVFSIGDEKEITYHVLAGGYENEKTANEVSERLSKKMVPHTIIKP